MARLRTYVHLTDDLGRAVVFGPDDVVPEWAQALITNSKAWLEPPASRLTEPAPAATVKKAPAKRAAPRRKAGGSAVSDG